MAKVGVPRRYRAQPEKSPVLKLPLVNMLDPVVLALAAEDVVEEGPEVVVAAAAFVVTADEVALPASATSSCMLPKPRAKLAAEELSLLQ